MAEKADVVEKGQRPVSGAKGNQAYRTSTRIGEESCWSDTRRGCVGGKGGERHSFF